MKRNITIFKYEHLWVDILILLIFLTIFSSHRIYYEFTNSVIHNKIIIQNIIAIILFAVCFLLIKKHTARIKARSDGLLLYFDDEIFFCPWEYITNIELNPYDPSITFKKTITKYNEKLNFHSEFVKSDIIDNLQYSCYVGGISFGSRRKCNDMIKMLDENLTNNKESISTEPMLLNRLSSFSRIMLILSSLALGFIAFLI